MNRFSNEYTRVLYFAVLLALIVVILGAYTRLSDAGLGCPDWPGCYGHVGVPEEIPDPHRYDRPLEHGKAWKEMIHRYVAGALGLVIVFIVIMVFRHKPGRHQGPVLPLLLLITVVFQALLGMWTVTMLLNPVIVTAHLIGGFTTLSLLWWLLLNQQDIKRSTEAMAALKIWAGLALLLLILQILLGGWTSTNYAALACGTDFPACAKQWWPEMDFASAFSFDHELEKNYEYGVLESPARTAIQVTHRIGALIVFIYFVVFAVRLTSTARRDLKTITAVMVILLLTQVSLGILNVVIGLPITVAVMHNLVAALLLLTTLTAIHRIYHG